MNTTSELSDWVKKKRKKHQRKKGKKKEKHTHKKHAACLEEVDVLGGVQSDNLAALDDHALLRLLRQTTHGGLRAGLLTLLDGLLALGERLVERLLAQKELLLALRRAHVLDTHVQALADKTVAHLLVQLDADRAARHVPHAARAAVVVLVRHALVDRAVDDNVHEVAHLVRVQVGRQRRQAVLPEVLRELSAGASANTKRVGHLASGE